MKWTGLVFWTVLALAGCGGGGGNPGTCNGSPQECGGVDGSPPPDTGGNESAVGQYRGSTDTGRTATTLVLQGGGFWILYGDAGNANLLGGFEQGTYEAVDGDITVANLVDFSATSGAVTANGRMTGNYVGGERIAGTVSFGTEFASFAGAYDPASNDPADVADAAGSYEGTLAVTDGSDTASVTVSEAGAITGTSTSGCTITGTLLSNSSANSYNLDVSLSGGVCGNEGSTLRGVAVLQGARLYSAGLDGIRSKGFVFSGAK